MPPDESLLAGPEVATSELGRALFVRVLMRRERGVQEPWAFIPFEVLDSTDPDAAREDIRERYVPATAHLIGDSSPEHRFATTVTASMTGFGQTIRTLGLFDGWNFDELAATTEQLSRPRSTCAHSSSDDDGIRDRASRLDWSGQ